MAALRHGELDRCSELRELPPLRLEAGNVGKMTYGDAAADVAAPDADVADAIAERAGLAADRVPPCYLDAWAWLNHQKPRSVSEAEWRLALDDGGRFLDAWGADAATMFWTAGELFDVPRDGRPGGLIWQLKGERVTALGGRSRTATTIGARWSARNWATATNSQVKD